MNSMLRVTAVALTVLLAGCDEAPPLPAPSNEASSAEDIQKQIQALPEGQRNGVFIRAIRDAGQECQHVESSEPAGTHRGFPVWNATCAGGGTWTIVIADNGNAQVLNAAEVRLADDGNQVAAHDAPSR